MCVIFALYSKKKRRIKELQERKRERQRETEGGKEVVMKDVTSALQLYRDCLRLVAYVAKQNGGDRRIMQEQVRAAFRKNKGSV